MSLIVITATVWGVLTGEWRNTGKKPLQIQIGGIVVLICAVTLLTWVSSKV
jgi:L-rhamnose-H+ transport protein